MFGSYVVINIVFSMVVPTLAMLFVVVAGTTQQHAVAVIVAVPTESGTFRVESSDFVSPCTQSNRKARKETLEVVSLYSSAVAGSRHRRVIKAMERGCLDRGLRIE